MNTITTGITEFTAATFVQLVDESDSLSPVYIETVSHEVVGRIKALRDESFDVQAAGQLHTFAYSDVRFVGWAAVGTATHCTAY